MGMSRIATVARHQLMHSVLRVYTSIACFMIVLYNVGIFGEDVAFGGVFRCTVGLRDKYGELL